MRSDPFDSESAVWQTTSWADHLPSAGRHFRASGGTRSHAARSFSGPSSYRRIMSDRSDALSGITPPFSPQGSVEGHHGLRTDHLGRVTRSGGDVDPVARPDVPRLSARRDAQRPLH